MIVSVIVPLYKGNSYVNPILDMLDKNAETLRKHAYHTKLELIFVNDSPDIPVKASGLSSEHGFSLIILNNPKNQGIHQSRVNGLNRSAGEWILMLDQDDCIEADCIYSQLKYTDGADLVIGNGYRMKGSDKKVIYRNRKKQQLSGKESIFLRAANQIISPGHCLIRKSSIPKEWYEFIIRENGGDDIFLWILMFEAHCRCTFNHSCIYTHVDTGENLSLDLGRMYRSSRNVAELMRTCGTVNEKNIRIYERRIRFLMTLNSGSYLKKILCCVQNPDICICKLYAYYR